MARIGLALGGGGVRGLAIIPLLDVLDEMGIRPCCISGTSMGAVIGALYASGMPATGIRTWVGDLLEDHSNEKGFPLKLMARWVSFKDLEFGRHGLFSGGRFMSLLQEATRTTRFEDLQIPLKVVATDFWAGKQVVLESGDLMAAIRASMSLPGLFTPARLHGRILIDGAGVNPVPHDVLTQCDAVVAIDLMGYMEPGLRSRPNVFRSILGIFDIMQNAVIEAKLKASPPDVYIKPDIYNIDVLDFDKTATVLRQAEPAREMFRREMTSLLARLEKV